jgi:hypothetical protein
VQFHGAGQAADVVSRCHNGVDCLAGARVAECGITIININIQYCPLHARRIHLHPPSPN